MEPRKESLPKSSGALPSHAARLIEDSWGVKGELPRPWGSRPNHSLEAQLLASFLMHTETEGRPKTWTVWRTLVQENHSCEKQTTEKLRFHPTPFPHLLSLSLCEQRHNKPRRWIEEEPQGAWMGVVGKEREKKEKRKRKRKTPKM